MVSSSEESLRSVEPSTFVYSLSIIANYQVFTILFFLHTISGTSLQTRIRIRAIFSSAYVHILVQNFVSKFYFFSENSSEKLLP